SFKLSRYLPSENFMMKRILIITFIGLILHSCSRNENMMVVSGNIKGLKKGLLYLQKVEDSILITIDSLEIRGDGAFTFEKELEHPGLFYLYLSKKDNNDINDRIAFFGEKGNISITTSWNRFETDAKIIGSESHNDYLEYQQMMSDFNKRDLELAQAAFREKDSLKTDSIEVLAERNYVNRYRYLLNFGLTHPNSFVTPYIAITDGPEANPIYLDSIYTILPDSIAQSSYGKILAKMVDGNSEN
ncbi:MAG: DUF4369 domain-containing protein, partial [Bacteroidota bacterium]